MDKENGSGGGSSKHKNSSSSSRQPTIDVNDPGSLLNAASLFGKSFLLSEFTLSLHDAIIGYEQIQCKKCIINL